MHEEQATNSPPKPLRVIAEQAQQTLSCRRCNTGLPLSSVGANTVTGIQINVCAKCHD